MGIVDRLLRRQTGQRTAPATGEPHDSSKYRVYKAAYIKVNGAAQWEDFRLRHSADPVPPWEDAVEFSRVYNESLGD